VCRGAGGARLPLGVQRGCVAKGRIDLNTYVRLVSTNPAKLFRAVPSQGHDRAGRRCRHGAVGTRGKRVTITNELMQHTIDYTPYDGMEGDRLAGGDGEGRGAWAMRDGKVQAEPGTGQFPAGGGGPYDLIKPTGVLPDGFRRGASSFSPGVDHGPRNHCRDPVAWRHADAGAHAGGLARVGGARSWCCRALARLRSGGWQSGGWAIGRRHCSQAARAAAFGGRV